MSALALSSAAEIDEVAQTNKVVVFAATGVEAQDLARELAAVTVLMIAQTPVAERAAALTALRDDDTVRVLITTYAAGAVGWRAPDDTLVLFHGAPAILGSYSDTLIAQAAARSRSAEPPA